MRYLLSFFIALTLSFPAVAAEVDAEASVITWTASKVTGNTHTGRIFPRSSEVNVVDGNIVSGKMVFEMATFTVTDMQGKWANKFLKHIKSSDFLHVEKFPTATIQINSVEGERATGDLTVMGKTQRIVLSLKKGVDKWTGKATFDRTQFGMTYGSDNFFQGLGDRAIEDLVHVAFELVVKS